MRWVTPFFLVLTLACCQHQKPKPIDKQKPEFCRDLDEIKNSGVLRALTDASSTSYFIYKGTPVGFEYDLLKRFAEEIGVRLEMVVVDNLGSIDQMLQRGVGDVIAANYTVTAGRSQYLSFSDPVLTTNLVAVQGIPDDFHRLSTNQRNSLLIDSVENLASRTVTVRPQSSFHAFLVQLQNHGIECKIDSNQKSTEWLLKAAADGKIDITIADKNVAKLNKMYHPNLRLSPPLGDDQPIAWAVRQNSPSLQYAINQWIKAFKPSLSFAAIRIKYFRARTWHSKRVMSAYSSIGGDHISAFDALFKKGANRLGWDWRLLAALVRKESNFNPNAESMAGAGGLMQLIPNTAQHFGADSIFDPAQNVDAGVRCIQAITNRWASDSLDSINLIKFTLASYNAGVAHIKDAQRLAANFGANPADWDEVSSYLIKLSKREYYSHPMVKYGYCRGIEPHQYVERVLDYWQHYKTGFPNQNKEP